MQGDRNEKSDRKYYLDNIRHIIVIMVVVYHVIYIFNSVGVVSNVPIKGIPAMDSFPYFVYPWLMCLLFLISGIGARYALEKRKAKEFAKNRVKKLLIPSVAGIFILGWITGLVTAQYSDIFMGNADVVPSIAKYFIYSLIGIGPLWFVHELFVASMALLLIRAIDKKDRLWELCEKANIVVLLLLFFAV